MSIKKLGKVMGYLLEYNRIIWLRMCKDSEVILQEGTVVMGPFPNWKGYKMLCQILAFEQSEAKRQQEAIAAIKGRPLFITPDIAARANLFVPPDA